MISLPLIWDGSLRATTSTLLACDNSNYQALHLEGQEVTVYKVEGYAQPLIRLTLRRHGYLWLMVDHYRREGAGLLWQAQHLLKQLAEGAYTLVGPIDLKSVLLPVFAVDAYSPSALRGLAQRSLRLSADAAAQPTEACSGASCHVAVNGPFIGFITRRDHAPWFLFYAGLDCLRRM